MKQKDKNLLLQDISARLPYGVKVNADFIDFTRIGRLISIDNNEELILSPNNGYPFDKKIEYCKPYLFPLSSMTEEQKNDLFNCCYNAEQEASKFSNGKLKFVYDYEIVKIDWFNKNHFDYRGLIEKDLALDATGLNIY